VKAAIIDRLPSGNLSVEKLARKLHTSARSLQRNLRNNGASYRCLLDETRRELGLQYVKDSKMSFTEIAFLLGFSDQSAFTRAFRRWTGLAPKEARRAL
jgi:AraC-like DNA-binding protein